jgi:uncharacterized protein YndB with AHSA1/START domain
MVETTMTHDTFIIERHLAHSPARVFSAFADAGRKRRWFGESSTHDVLSFVADFRVGGIESARYRLNASTPFPGIELNHEGTILDIVPDVRIAIASTMAFGDKRISATLATFEFLHSPSGTTLVCTHQAVYFEGADGPIARRAGMEALLDRLAQQLDA